jgi:excinuclease ABC subunit A
VNVGLDYLTLSRAAGTLSGGESQRIRLASQIGSGLTGVLYVLDEPSIGLHQRDNDRLLTTLKNLRDQGNTVLVVEHDEDAIREADYVFDMGPGAGCMAGRCVATARRPKSPPIPASLTGQYLSGAREIAVPEGAAQGQRQEAHRGRRDRQQPEKRHGRVSAGQVRLRDRRVGRRQIDPDHRDAVQDRRHAAERRA